MSLHPFVRRALPLVALAAAAALWQAPARSDGDAKKAEEPKKADADADAKAEGAKPSADAATPRVSITSDGKTHRCARQKAQDFLIRGNWFPRTNDAEAQKKGRQLLQDAIRYRTEKYGYFPGFGSAKLNAHAPKHYAESTSFMGMTVTVNKRIIPALKCVEADLKATGAHAEYHPKAMGGIRFKNTYRGVEVSNHVYGIAIDIEPNLNTCCGCVKPWNEHPLCKKKVKSVYERMAMPESWVHAFERYGFYWLGHDVLQDTMHFEFLGDPDKILE